MEFTNATIAALSLPADKTDAIFFDDGLPGFGLRLRTGGKRSWIVQYRANGRTRRETLGDLRKIDLRAARTAAEKKFAEVLLGGDPAAAKAAARAKAALTFGPLVDKYLALKEGRVRKNTYIADKRYLATYFKGFRGQPIDAITRRMVAARLNDIIAERGSTAAARARQSLSAFFSWAIREGMTEMNPVMGTNDPAGHIDARDRVLAEAEMRSIWLACGEDDFGRIVRLLMLTGCRRDEIGGLQWGELDLDRSLLKIPGGRTKNHHPLQLTLPGKAVEILNTAPRQEGREFVFGFRGGAFSRWSWEKLSLDSRILKAGATVAPWRLHDIRRTVATGMAELGVAPHIIEAILNHRGGHKAGVAGIYNRATYDVEMKRALTVWAEHLLSVIERRTPIVLSYRVA